MVCIALVEKNTDALRALDKLRKSELRKEGSSYTHSQLIAAAHWARTHTKTLRSAGLDPSQYSLSALLKGASVSLPPLPSRQKSPHLERILEEARREAARREEERNTYSTATSNANSNYDEDWILIRKQLGAVFNVIASMLAMATAVWWASAYNYSNELRVASSLASAIFIGAVESFLYYRYFSQPPSAKLKGAFPRKSKITFEHDGKTFTFVPENTSKR